jgi:PRTRC genetic system protein B
MSGRSNTRRKLLPVTALTTEPPTTQYADYRLASVLCLYEGPQSAVSVSMLHTVDSKGRLHDGRPVDPVAFAKSIYRLKKGELDEKLTLVGENILAENRDAVMWWRPASVTPMYFKTAEPNARLTALNGIPLPQPPLVFRASKNHEHLECWALVDNGRPSPSTPLFHAPYMNMSPAPRVYLGILADNAISNPQKKSTAEWERVFFGSNFSHTPPPIRNVKTILSKTEAATAREEALDCYITLLETLREEQARCRKKGRNACPAWSRYLAPARVTLAESLAT